MILRKRKKVVILLVFALIIIIGFIFLRSFVIRISPIITSISEEEVRAITSNAVREATLEVLADNPGESFEEITYDKDGNIVAIQINQSMLNDTVQKVGVVSQKMLAMLGTRGIDIPIGSLSGFVFLAGKGPSVNIKIIPVGSISVDISSEFDSKGINQTNHKIYLKINSDVNIVLPGTNNSISTLTEVLMCDTVIVGKIPDVYLNTMHRSYDFLP